MKKIHSLYVLSLFSITLVACLPGSSDKKDVPTPPQPTPTSVAETPTPTKTTQSYGNPVTLSSLVTRSGDKSSLQVFKDTISQGNVVVDFHATWCGPCRALAPIITNAAKDFDHVLFLKVDTDQHKSVASNYGVRSLPTVY